MSEQLKTPVPPNEFVDHDYSEVNAQTKRKRDFLDAAERRGGGTIDDEQMIPTGSGGLEIETTTSVTPKALAEELKKPELQTVNDDSYY